MIHTIPFYCFLVLYSTITQQIIKIVILQCSIGTILTVIHNTQAATLNTILFILEQLSKQILLTLRQSTQLFNCKAGKLLRQMSFISPFPQPQIAPVFLLKKLLPQQPSHRKSTRKTASTPLMTFLPIQTPIIAQSAAASLNKKPPQKSPLTQQRSPNSLKTKLLAPQL
jgi:hypothetical protein